MNMARKLLSFAWEPIIKHVAYCLGFRTPNALRVFKNGVDHHRTLQVMESMFEALLKELLVPYVRDCMLSDPTKEPTAEEYFKWYNESVTNEKYAYIFNLTFYYLLSFQMFHEGVRKNNSNVMMAGRTVFAPLFFVGHHPKYQHLLLRDMVERVNYPAPVKEYMVMTESHTASGNRNGGQGGDFIHEELNRSIKSYLQGCGIPTKDNWLNIIRKAEKLSLLKDRFLKETNVDASSGKKKPKKFEHEVTMIRKQLRVSRYLEKYDEVESLETINGECLDEDLCDFIFLAEKNYKEYKAELIKEGTYGTLKLEPIFITDAERKEFAKIENKRIDEIIDETLKLLECMKKNDTVVEVTKRLKRKTKMKKHQYIDLFYEVAKELETQNAEIAFDVSHEEEIHNQDDN